MLTELEIENFALVSRLSLSFEAGLTTLTGETGAGKSILLDSVSFLLGGPCREEAPEEGARWVAGRFTLTAEARALLRQWDIPVDEEQALLSRELKATGRSSCRINNRPVTLANLRELGEEFVDLHGQHQSHALKRPSRHLELLDRVAGKDHLEQLEAYQQAYRQAQELKNRLDDLKAAERDRIRELEWLGHELEEIAQVDPQVGEEELLEEEFRKLAAAEELARGSAEVSHLLSDDRGCVDRLATAARRLAQLSHHDPSLEPLSQRLAEAEIQVSELARDLSSYSDEVVANPARLDQIQSRLERLKTLKRKYGESLLEVLEYGQQKQLRLQQLQSADQQVEQLGQEYRERRRHLETLAGQLSQGRRKTARRLEGEVVQELVGLAMPEAVFEVRFEPVEELSLAGLENADFWMSPNPGREPRPLAKVASGGELSRVMLALIGLFARYDAVPTRVFDEIDVGLGGRAAEAVANRLQELAQGSQVVCVTHLAVVAARADHHYKVTKVVEDGVTRVAVEQLEPSERTDELARMLSGDASPQAARAHAQELLRGAAAGMT